jgi:hypothetical protein
MGNGLAVKHEAFLSKADSLVLEIVAKAKRRDESSLIGESHVEWFARNGLLSEEEETRRVGFVTRAGPVAAASGLGPHLPDHPHGTKWSP